MLDNAEYDPTLHLLLPFHVVADNSCTMCACTSVAYQLGNALVRQGYKVFDYGVSGSTMESTHVPVASREDLITSFGELNPRSLFRFRTQMGTPWYRAYLGNLVAAVRGRYQRGDIVLHTYNHAYSYLVESHPSWWHLEPLIGYHPKMTKTFKVFQSLAYLHYWCGTQNMAQGSDFMWQIPYGFDTDAWQCQPADPQYLLFMGGLRHDKGLNVVKEIAARTDIPVHVYGDGDPSLLADSNAKYCGMITGEDRNGVYRHAYATLMPTRKFEQFGCVAVESLLCGIPVMCSAFGSLPEIIQHGVNGLHCRTLGDWMRGINHVKRLRGCSIAAQAAATYNLDVVGEQYSRVIQQICGLQDGGWYDWDHKGD